ncbi:MAG: cytochrome c biogenesis protein CcdA [Desulfobacterales bacterium]|nr:cytochrome c biogenesis protein CcdA [Desulfobacterales bacterium]
MLVETVPYPAAFLFGLLSFFSPCVLPLLPAYFSFISGYSLEELTDGSDATVRRKVILSTTAFVLGFSAVFIALGMSASLIGNLAHNYRDAIRIAGGILIILFGIHMSGIYSFPLLNYEGRLHLEKKPLHALGTFLIGMAFAAGWSPCMGPQLGSILIIAGSRETIWQGTLLLGIYSAGLAIPFLVLSFFINYLIQFLQRVKKAIRVVNVTAGILLIAMGLLLLSNKLTFLMFTG